MSEESKYEFYLFENNLYRVDEDDLSGGERWAGGWRRDATAMAAALEGVKLERHEAKRVLQELRKTHTGDEKRGEGPSQVHAPPPEMPGGYDRPSANTNTVVFVMLGVLLIAATAGAIWWFTSMGAKGTAGDDPFAFKPSMVTIGDGEMEYMYEWRMATLEEKMQISHAHLDTIWTEEEQTQNPVMEGVVNEIARRLTRCMDEWAADPAIGDGMYLRAGLDICLVEVMDDEGQ